MLRLRLSRRNCVPPHNDNLYTRRGNLNQTDCHCEGFIPWQSQPNTLSLRSPLPPFPKVLPVGETSRSDRGGAASGEEGGTKCRRVEGAVAISTDFYRPSLRSPQGLWQSQPIISSYKSFHSGFISVIYLFFRARFQPLICFSRAIAYSGSEYCS